MASGGIHPSNARDSGVEMMTPPDRRHPSLTIGQPLLIRVAAKAMTNRAIQAKCEWADDKGWFT